MGQWKWQLTYRTPKKRSLLSFSLSQLERNHVLMLAVQTQAIKQLDSSKSLYVNACRRPGAQRFSLRDL
jgi:hypothetical protein